MEVQILVNSQDTSFMNPFGGALEGPCSVWGCSTAARWRRTDGRVVCDIHRDDPKKFRCTFDDWRGECTRDATCYFGARPYCDIHKDGLTRLDPPPKHKATILDKARDIVDGARQSDYGTPENNFTKIGRVWGALLNLPDIPPRTVADMLIGLKVVRDTHFAKEDNLVDAAGYAYAASLLHNPSSKPSK